MRYDIALIDADGTLYDFNAAEESALYGAMAHFDISCTPDIYGRYHAINDALWRMHERGEITQADLRRRRFDELFEGFGLPLDADTFAPVYLALLAQGAQLLPGARELIWALHGKIRLCIATNGIGEVQRSRISRSGLESCFEALLISGELGAQKPDRAFFSRAFERLGNVDPGRAIILGDSLTSDMRGGKNAGIATCWFNPSGGPCAHPELCDYEIDRLDKFVTILE